MAGGLGAHSLQRGPVNLLLPCSQPLFQPILLRLLSLQHQVDTHWLLLWSPLISTKCEVAVVAGMSVWRASCILSCVNESMAVSVPFHLAIQLMSRRLLPLLIAQLCKQQRLYTHLPVSMSFMPY